MKTKLLLLVLLLFFGWLVGREWWWRDHGPSVPPVIFVIDDGASVSDIADDLETRDIIGSSFLFKVYVKLTARARKLQAGEFELSEGMNASSVLSVITNAQANEISLTFVEGWTIAQMSAYLAEEGVVSSSDWMTSATHDLEGYLFPDTYRFLKGVTAQEIVSRMREEMEEKINAEMRAEMERQGKSLHDVLTMASIIEREVRHDEDRELVSDVFWKRLAIGMPLQADSTVNYITRKKTPSISFDDREINSPYNTYKYRGLPPGPISAPGLASIQAAIFPRSNPYYFFLTDEEGNAHYARTLDEHNVNKARELK
ncbi:TPA: endolytic transglycosylase MltG [Candidatus Uhrbacteria bacterium]|nr:MAG: Aminodeoxychorismate lyase [Parcubacteria group bacterium GW2011_GWA2_53_21]OGL71781.1 MAG: hypothetical protein A3D69_01885 [Candidatus Uhrbacteria bacterium RIFCSPHIGHO2_02_FULL_54_11]HBL39516.1 endolytic transglycosylase MltG [Candidatus Uhrbacteria bacterium]